MDVQLTLSKEEFWDALTLRRVVDKYGTVRWFNPAGVLHREGGPALEYSDGRKSWYLNGIWIRDGEAVEPF